MHLLFFFCLLSLKWGAFGRPKKADEKMEGFAFPSGAADRHPTFLLTTPRLPGETGEVLQNNISLVGL